MGLVLVNSGFGIPSPHFTHCPLPHLALDLDLHTLHSFFQLGVLLRVTLLAAPLPDIPCEDDDDRQRDGEGPIDPELVGDGRGRTRGVAGGRVIGRRRRAAAAATLAVLEIEECHAEDGLDRIMN